MDLFLLKLFDFDIVNFPFLDGDNPRRASCDVYISQLIRFARVCNNVADFNPRNKCLTAKLLQQGYRYHKLIAEHWKSNISVIRSSIIHRSNEHICLLHVVCSKPPTSVHGSCRLTFFLCMLSLQTHISRHISKLCAKQT